MSDARVPMTSVVEAFGLSALAYPPDSAEPVETTIVWVPDETFPQPEGLGFGRPEPRRVMAILTADLPHVPHEMRIDAPDVDGGETKSWRVDGVDSIEWDHRLVRVVEAEE